DPLPVQAIPGDVERGRIPGVETALHRRHIRREGCGPHLSPQVHPFPGHATVGAEEEAVVPREIHDQHPAVFVNPDWWPSKAFSVFGDGGIELTPGRSTVVTVEERH